MSLQQKRGGPGNHRRGHRSTRQAEVIPRGRFAEQVEVSGVCRLLNLIGPVVIRIEEAPTSIERDDLVAGGDDVGLEDQVHPARSPAGIGCNAVVRPYTVHVFRGPDGDDVGVVPWRLDRAVVRAPAFVALSRVVVCAGSPGVPGSADDDDASFVGGFDGLTEGVRGVAFTDGVSEGKVDDPNIEGGLVVDDPLNAGNHCADIGAALAIEYTDTDQISLRGNPVKGVSVPRSGRIRAVSGDDAGDMSAVAARVVTVAVITAGQ